MGMEFKVIKNKLGMNEIMNYLRVENDVYEVTMHYVGDYITDFNAGKIDTVYLSLTCKPKINTYQLNIVKGLLFIDIGEGLVLTMSTLDKHFHKLKLATDSMQEISKVLKEYFGIEDCLTDTIYSVTSEGK